MRTGEYTTDHAVFTCRNCDRVVLGNREFLQGQNCCNAPLRESTESDVTPTTPTLGTVSQAVFGLPQNGFDIYQCTIDEGEATVATVAERLGYERSVITRYLNTLSETGLLQKTARVRKGGGEVNVYDPLPVTEIERETILGLYLWSASAAEILADINTDAEVKPGGGQQAQKLATVFWD